MSHCIKCKSFKGSRTKKYIDEKLEKYWYQNLEPVRDKDEGLKKKIFEQLKNANSISDISKLFAYTGNDAETKMVFIILLRAWRKTLSKPFFAGTLRQIYIYIGKDSLRKNIYRQRFP